MSRRRNITAEYARDLLERDGGCCVGCGAPIWGDRGTDWSVHHRIPRGMGGTSDPRVSAPSNLVILCGSGTSGCHGEVESRRVEARARGLLLWRSQDPEAVPVQVRIGGQSRLYLFDDVGGRVEVPHVRP